MGSSSSFSTGGPGKGMHSRCTKNLMNRTHCLESVSNQNDLFSDSGIFGLVALGDHRYA